MNSVKLKDLPEITLCKKIENNNFLLISKQGNAYLWNFDKIKWEDLSIENSYFSEYDFKFNLSSIQDFINNMNITEDKENKLEEDLILVNFYNL